MTGKIRAADVLVVVAHYPPAYKGGGPIRTVSAMVQSTPEQQRSRIAILTSSYDHGDRAPLSVPRNEWTEFDRVPVRYGDPGLRGLVRLLRDTRGFAAKAMYLNGAFSPAHSILPVLLATVRWWRTDRVVIAPRGEFDPGALALKSKKKSLMRWIYRLLPLYRNAAWHASSDLEARNILRFVGPHARVLVKENETLLPATAIRSSYRDVERDTSAVRLVHIGRISPKKRVHVLLEALEGVDGIQLDIYGPSDDPRYLATCERLAAAAKSESTTVSFHGAIEPHEVLTTFAAAQFACFPTAGENFGHVIAEALAASCPVIVADVTPWTATVRAGRGFVLQTGEVDEWRAVLSKVATLSRRDRTSRIEATENAYNDWSASREHTSFLAYLLSGAESTLKFAGDGAG